MSIDNGANWTAINTGITNTDIHSLAVVGTTIFAGTSKGGVFVSTNNGADWIPVNAGLPAADINSLVTDGATIFAGTGGGGVWTRQLSEFLGINSYSPNSNIRIYPNPAADKVTISNSANISQETTISIFNITGQKIMSSNFEHKNKMEVYVSTLAKGVYVLQIQVGSEVENRKLIIE